MVKIFSFVVFLCIHITSIFASSFVPEIKFHLTADGLKIRTALWKTSEPKKGTVLILEGMGGFIEGFQETAEQLLKRGFDVMTFDWRGQGGSTRVTTKPTLLHVNNFELYRRDLDQIVKSIPDSAGALFIIGSSMGGHLALRYVHDHPQRVKAVIAIAPMVEIKTGAYPKVVAEGLAKSIVFLGLGERFVFGYGEHKYKQCVRAYHPEKHGDQERYLQRCQQLKGNPMLAIGGPSFAWLDAAFHSCKKLSRASYAKDIETPVLMIVPERDHLVSPGAQEQLCQNISRCQVIKYSDSHHDILRENDVIFARFWEDFDNFMANFIETNPSS
jgi:lysophospholipase